MNIFTEEFQNVKKVFDMTEFSLWDGRTRNVIEIILEKVANNVNDCLYFFSVRLWSFTKAKQLYHGLREDNFAYFEVDLIIFEYINLINTPFDPNILKDGHHNPNDLTFLLFSHPITRYFCNYQ